MQILRRPGALVVEDEPLIRKIAAAAFSATGFEVIEAKDAAEALSLHAADGSIGILFTDVNMPGALNGVDLAEQIHDRQPSIGIIITSAVPVSRPLDRLGIFIAKPYSPKAVSITAMALLAKGAAHEAAG